MSAVRSYKSAVGSSAEINITGMARAWQFNPIEMHRRKGRSPWLRVTVAAEAADNGHVHESDRHDGMEKMGGDRICPAVINNRLSW